MRIVLKILAFETATEACSVALWIDGVARERFEIAPRRHTELALPWAEQLLAEAGIAKSQLDIVAVGRGPGAFTGVRLAIALAQGTALALDRPVIPVSTLAALAMQAPAQSTRVSILAAIDARISEIYSAIFEREGMMLQALSTEIVSPAHSVESPDDSHPWHGVGTGFAAQNGALQHRFESVCASIDAVALPHAIDVARLAAIAFHEGAAIAPDALLPAYLRDRVALTLQEQAQSRAAR